MTKPRYMLNAMLEGEIIRHGPFCADEAFDMAVAIHGAGHTAITLTDLENDQVLPIGNYLR
ncbi:MAG: hypothetical protein ACOYM5_11845 [Caulobacter sp.]|jgi:hypothetical protein